MGRSRRQLRALSAALDLENMDQDMLWSLLTQKEEVLGSGETKILLGGKVRTEEGSANGSFDVDGDAALGTLGFSKEVPLVQDVSRTELGAGVPCIQSSGHCGEVHERGNCNGSVVGKKFDHLLDSSLAPSVARVKEAGRRGRHRKSKSGIPKPPRCRLPDYPGTSNGSASCGDLDFGGFQCEDWPTNMKLHKSKSQIPSPPVQTDRGSHILLANHPRKVSSTQEIVSICSKSLGSALESFGSPESAPYLATSEETSTNFASLGSLFDSSFDEDPLCKGSLETLVQSGPTPQFMGSGDIRSVVDRLLDVEGLSDKDPSSWLFDLQTNKKQNGKESHLFGGLKTPTHERLSQETRPYQKCRTAVKKIQSEMQPGVTPPKAAAQDCGDKATNQLAMNADSPCSVSGEEGDADFFCISKGVGIGKGLASYSSKEGSRNAQDGLLGTSDSREKSMLDSTKMDDCSMELELFDSAGSSVLEWNITSPRLMPGRNTSNECDSTARGNTEPCSPNEAPFIAKSQADAGVAGLSFSPLLPECLWSASGLSGKEVSNAWTKWSTLSSQSYCALPGQTGEEYAECSFETGDTIGPMISSTANSPKFARCMMSIGSLQASGAGSCARLRLDDLDTSINEDNTVEFNVHQSNFALIEVGDLLHQFNRKTDLKSFIQSSQHLGDSPGVASSHTDLGSVCSLSVRDWIMSSSSQRSSKDICTATTIGSVDCITSWPPLTELHIKEGFKSNGPNPLWMSRGHQPDGVLVSRDGDMLWNDQAFHCSNGACYPWVSRAGCTSGKTQGEISPWAGSVGRDVTCLSSNRQLWYSPPKMGLALKWASSLRRRKPESSRLVHHEDSVGCSSWKLFRPKRKECGWDRVWERRQHGDTDL